MPLRVAGRKCQFSRAARHLLSMSSSEALQDCFIYDLAALVDRNFDDLIAGRKR